MDDMREEFEELMKSFASEDFYPTPEMQKGIMLYLNNFCLRSLTIKAANEMDAERAGNGQPPIKRDAAAEFPDMPVLDVVDASAVPSSDACSECECKGVLTECTGCKRGVHFWCSKLMPTHQPCSGDAPFYCGRADCMASEAIRAMGCKPKSQATETFKCTICEEDKSVDLVCNVLGGCTCKHERMCTQCLHEWIPAKPAGITMLPCPTCRGEITGVLRPGLLPSDLGEVETIEELSLLYGLGDDDAGGAEPDDVEDEEEDTSGEEWGHVAGEGDGELPGSPAAAQRRRRVARVRRGIHRFRAREQQRVDEARQFLAEENDAMVSRGQITLDQGCHNNLVLGGFDQQLIEDTGGADDNDRAAYAARVRGKRGRQPPRERKPADPPPKQPRRSPADMSPAAIRQMARAAQQAAQEATSSAAAAIASSSKAAATSDWADPDDSDSSDSGF